MFHELRVSIQTRLTWLALTPEPERELPILVAALRCAAEPDPAAAGLPGPTVDNRQDRLAAAEAKRVDHLVLRGTARSWQRYLHEITALIQAAGPFAPPGTTLAAAEVVLDHHRMLIGLPGGGYRRTATDRDALAALIDTLERSPQQWRYSPDKDHQEGEDKQ